MKKLAFLLICCFLLFSCENISVVGDFLYILGEIVLESNNQEENTPEDDTIDYIRNQVLEYAELYCKADTEYVWGGQDTLRSIKVDCSGMVINCYKYGIKGTNYKLLFDDTTSSNLYSKFTNHTTNPKPGDLIFMGDKNSSTINHVGIFVKFDNEYVHFIDATEGIGVSKRKYQKSNKVIKGYGEMKFSM